MVKEMKKLVSCIRCVVTQHGMLQVPVSSPTLGDAELVGIIGDVIGVTVSVSVALFSGVAVSFSTRKLTWTQIVKLSRKNKRVINKEYEGIEELADGVESILGNLKKKGVEEVRSVLKKMKDLDSCICGIESVSEKVFRALINYRVALLNTLSQ